MADSYKYRGGSKRVEEIPVASGTVIEIGNLLKLSSGKVVVMAATADNLDFCGVAEQAHGALDPSGTLAVGVPNVETTYEYTLDAATDVTWGDRLQWSTGHKLKKSTTDGIAIAVQSKLQATTILCKFLLPAKTGNTNRIADAS